MSSNRANTTPDTVKHDHEPTEEELDAMIAEQSKLENLPNWWPKDAVERLKRSNRPCKFDHNGECLICDCWPSDCAFDRLFNGDFKHETFAELLAMFQECLTPDEVKSLKEKYEGVKDVVRPG